MEQRFYDALQDCPIIAAVRDEAGLDACLASDVRMVFTLFGDVCSIPAIVDRIRAANKFAVVHLDRVTGLTSKEVAVDFIRQSTRADGVISTHTNLIQYAKGLGLFTVLRAFLIDSIALDNLVAVSRIRPDALDILPGLMLMNTLTDKLCRKELYISPYGVREGYLCHKLLNAGT